MNLDVDELCMLEQLCYIDKNVIIKSVSRYRKLKEMKISKDMLNILEKHLFVMRMVEK